ncbi:MAG: polysaccharide deacetylase family protein [Rhodoferax sp.]|jgi:peptidoglycan/xylan/chitin deacetylase (PgdA/CDA1 family)|nr:polysaccharide deacetylase family protein [Rhodoferax sp.]
MTDVCANAAPIAVLVYHQIDQAPARGAPFRSLYVAPETFARQMRCLQWLGYQGLSMTTLLPYLRGDKTGRVVGITFDDGYLNNLTLALPVLNRHGFSSTCYAVSQCLGQTNVWDRATGMAPAPLMDAGQLRQWLAGGQEIGAHTRHHVHLPELDAAASLKEMALGKAELEAVTQAPVAHFCYPYGDYCAEHVALARQAGFSSAATSRRGRCHAGQDLLQLCRVPVLRSTSWPVFWLKLATRYEDRRTV